MARPRLSAALTWLRFEQAVHAVFTEALRRLGGYARLPSAEEPINLELYWIVLKVHQELLSSTNGNLPYTIIPDSTNQPEPDDSARSGRLKKRPDFCCILKNAQAEDFRLSQVNYYLECKRLGQAEGNWVLNENYSEHGMARFMRSEWGYGKGCASATMVGYVQNMDPETVLGEVNTHTTMRAIPSLTRAATGWVARNVTLLSQSRLTREFDNSSIQLHHFWMDLRQCRFDIPSDQPPQSAAPAAPAKLAKKKIGSNKPTKKSDLTTEGHRRW
jgi:hypothetical protein